MASVPVFDAKGQPTAYRLMISAAGSDDCRVQLDEGFAGREVDEEISRVGLMRLAEGAKEKNFEALGFSLEGREDGIEGIVSVGSGYDRFRIEAAALKSALAEI